jgi:transitional endoplasmic reticulum ATPase
MAETLVNIDVGLIISSSPSHEPSLIINPKTISYVMCNPMVRMMHRNMSNIRKWKYGKLKSGDRQATLIIEFDPKIPMGKCAVPLPITGWLGTRSTLDILSTLDPLDEVQIELVSGKSESWKVSPRHTTGYIATLLRGRPMSNGQPFVASISGRLLSFRASCLSDSGIVNSETVIRYKHTNMPDKCEVVDNHNKGFGAVGGLEDVIIQIVGNIKKPLTESVMYSQFGLKPPRGMILHGPPGTGKTLLARSLAFELGDTLVKSVKATELSGPDSDMKVHDLFRLSKSEASEAGKRSLLIFIDELDALCPSRETAVGESERRAVAALLTEMDGFSVDADLPIVVIGATNRINSIDAALRRPGRFEREIEIPPPDASGRFDILGIVSRNQFAKIWSPSTDELHEIAAITHGFVGADLVSLISQSALRAIETGKNRITVDDVRESLNFVSPSALRELSISVPSTRWSEIGGYQDVKDHLIEAVIWPVKHAEEFKRMHVEGPRGVLLYGPPGCSKTMMARAAATESSMNFIAVKGPEVFSKWVGESEQAIRNLFQKARQASPCIIFFDEIDAIGGQRDSSGDSGVGSRVLTQLLTEMDGLGPLKQVVIVAATNRPHILDPALLRPGRFDRLVYVGLPDSGARIAIWSTLLKSIPHNLHDWDPDYLSKLSDLSNGYSGAEVTMIVKEAAILAIRGSLQRKSDDIVDDIITSMDSLSLEPNGNILVRFDHIEQMFRKCKPRTDQNALQKLQEFEARNCILD